MSLALFLVINVPIYSQRLYLVLKLYTHPNHPNLTEITNDKLPHICELLSNHTWNPYRNSCLRPLPRSLGSGRQHTHPQTEAQHYAGEQQVSLAPMVSGDSDVEMSKYCGCLQNPAPVVIYPIIYRFSTFFDHPKWRRISQPSTVC